MNPFLLKQDKRVIFTISPFIIRALSYENLYSEVDSQVRIDPVSSSAQTSHCHEFHHKATIAIYFPECEKQRHWPNCAVAQSGLCCSHSKAFVQFRSMMISLCLLKFTFGLFIQSSNLLRKQLYYSSSNKT